MTSTTTQNTPRRRINGTVVAQKMQKTLTVLVTRTVMHAKYHKRYMVSKKYLAHNEREDVKVGDAVVIEETRPLSSRKRWRVVAKV